MTQPPSNDASLSQHLRVFGDDHHDASKWTTSSAGNDWRIDSPTQVPGSDGSTERGHCQSELMQRWLSDATLATGTSAAVVYLLDDDTERLSTKAVFGLASAERVGTSRPLRGSRTDLEAMIRGVIAVDDTLIGPIDTWRFPEPFPAAICACLGAIDFPLGTLWLFANQPTEFSDAASAAARIAAAQLSAWIDSGRHASGPNLAIRTATDSQNATNPHSDSEPIHPLPLTPVHPVANEFDDATTASANIRSGHDTLAESFDLLQEKATTLDRMVNHIATWQHRTLPVGTRLAGDYLVDGWIDAPIEIAQSWHHWDVLPDGQLAIAMCETAMRGRGARIDVQDVLSGAMGMATLKAHAAYRHRPEDALWRMLDTLSQIDDHLIDDHGHFALSLIYGHVDPDTGEADLATYGDWHSLVISHRGYRPLAISENANHRDAIDGLDMMVDNLFADPDTLTHPLDRRPAKTQTRLQPGEVLFIGGDWMRHAVTPDHPSMSTLIGNTIASSLRAKKQHPLSAVQRRLCKTVSSQERTAITLHRLDIEK
ncbi:MAG: sporulation stage II, protein E [Planctomycetota bacterium]